MGTMGVRGVFDKQGNAPRGLLDKPRRVENDIDRDLCSDVARRGCDTKKMEDSPEKL